MALVRERDLVIPALKAAATMPEGEITASELIVLLTDEFQPEGRDAEIADGGDETYFSLKIRNLLENRDSETGMFKMKYATFDEKSGSLRITDAGRAFLDQVPDA